MFKIKQFLFKDNKQLLKLLKKYYYAIASITFLIDADNKTYFYINNCNDIIFYNHSNILLELLSYFKLYTNKTVNIKYINKTALINKNIVFLNDFLKDSMTNKKAFKDKDYYYINNLNDADKSNYIDLKTIFKYVFNDAYNYKVTLLDLYCL